MRCKRGKGGVAGFGEGRDGDAWEAERTGRASKGIGGADGLDSSILDNKIDDKGIYNYGEWIWSKAVW